MVQKFIIILFLGASGVLCASMQAIAKETSLAVLGVKNPPKPDPYRYAVTQGVALADTTRRSSFAELARLAAGGIISMRSPKRARGKRGSVRGDEKTKSRLLAMKHKNRR